MDGCEVPTVMVLSVMQDHGNSPVTSFGYGDPIIGVGHSDDRRDFQLSVVLGPLILKALESLNVEDQTIRSSIQILTFFFIGPLIDQFSQGDGRITLRADEIDRYLLSFFQDTRGLEVEEFAPNAWWSRCGVEVTHKVTYICLLFVIEMCPDIHELMDLCQQARSRGGEKGPEGLMKSAPRSSRFHGEATHPAPAPEDRVAKAPVAIIGGYAGEILGDQA